MLRSMLLGISRSARVRALLERSAVGKRVSSRFVAGLTIVDALSVCANLNREGISATLDSLGESVTDEAQAKASAEIYHRLLDQIESRGLKANVSVKLTQVGMDVDPALAEQIVVGMVEHAAATRSFVRLDMEGSAYTEATIALTERVHARPGLQGHIGTVLQAYLKRTEADTERLLRNGIRIRLCKGAYDEPATIAFAEKAAVDLNYIRLMKRMVTFTRDGGEGVFCGIATHDEAILDQLRRFAVLAGLSKKSFEVQMLYGVRRDLQRSLAREGFGVRVYVPFGPEWFPYFMRRLAERPANLLFLVRNFFRS